MSMTENVLLEISCTARTMFGSAGGGTSVHISASTPTSKSARNLDGNPPTNVLSGPTTTADSEPTTMLSTDADPTTSSKGILLLTLISSGHEGTQFVVIIVPPETSEAGGNGDTVTSELQWSHSVPLVRFFYH